MTLVQIAAVLGCLYVTIGFMNTLHNWDSSLARYHREQCIEQKRYALLVLAPIFMSLIWPIKFWLVWKIRKMERSGELQKIVDEAKREHMEKEHGVHRKKDDS